MSHFDVVRAWKNVSYRESLSAEDQAVLPEHPAGTLELYDAELGLIVGGEAELVAGDCWPIDTWGFFSSSCCLTQGSNITSCGASCR